MSISLRWAGVLVLVLVIASVAVAQHAFIRLSKIPDNLSLPVPSGTNLVLTATITGAPPEAVWLARTDARATSVPLTQVSPAEYQMNLADPQVLAALRGPANNGQFRIFARVRGGRTIETLPIRYQVRLPETAPLRFEILTAKKRRELDRSEATSNWTVPDDAQRIEATVEERSTSPAIEALAGTRVWPFRTVDRRTLALELTPEIRQVWQQDGVLTIRWGGAEDSRLLVKAVPDRLLFKGSSVTLTMTQSTAVEAPGSRGYVWIKIGDIAGWRMLLTITTVLRETLVESTPVREDHKVAFALAREKYILTVLDISNSLINDDIATLRIDRAGAIPPPAAPTPYKTPAATPAKTAAPTTGPAEALTPKPGQAVRSGNPTAILASNTPVAVISESEKIERLLKMIEGSNLVFIREGAEYKGKDGAAHLRHKLKKAGSRVKTLNDFVGGIASQSSMTGRPYKIRLPDGKVMESKDWLQQRAREMGLSP